MLLDADNGTRMILGNTDDTDVTACPDFSGDEHR